MANVMLGIDLAKNVFARHGVNEAGHVAIDRPGAPSKGQDPVPKRTSKSALGAYFRRVCPRMDKPTVITAAAHKLARLIYTLHTKGQEYTDQGQDYFEERYRKRVLHNLTQRAVKMGMRVVPAEVVA